MIKRWILMALLAASVLLTSACQTTDDPYSRDHQRASSMPWSRQESWEGNPYGGMFPNSR